MTEQMMDGETPWHGCRLLPCSVVVCVAAAVMPETDREPVSGAETSE